MNISIYEKKILETIFIDNSSVTTIAKQIIRIFPEKSDNKFFVFDALRYVLNIDFKTALPIFGWSHFGGELSDAKIDSLISNSWNSNR
jgi:hypothetical protein